MKQEYQDQIDKYVLDQMDDTEKSAFEQEAAQNSELQEQLQFTRVVTTATKSREKKLAKMENWEDVLMIAKQMTKDDMIIMINARPSTPSYNPLFEQVPNMLSRFFMSHSFMLVYPEQETGAAVPDILTGDTPHANATWSLASAIKRWVLSFQQTTTKDRKA